MTAFRFPDPERYCLMEAEDLGEGRWRHTCMKCGIVREGTRPNYARECDLWWLGIGSRGAAILKLMGITPARVSALIRRPCGCNKRREAIDRLDFRCRRWLRRWVKQMGGGECSGDPIDR